MRREVEARKMRLIPQRQHLLLPVIYGLMEVLARRRSLVLGLKELVLGIVWQPTTTSICRLRWTSIKNEN